MTTPVITARAHWPVARAAELMRHHQVTALPVVDADNRLIGIVSDADALAERVYSGHASGHRSVGSIMAIEVVAVPPGLELGELTARLVAGGRRAVPVVDGDRVIGMINRHGLLR